MILTFDYRSYSITRERGCTSNLDKSACAELLQRTLRGQIRRSPICAAKVNVGRGALDDVFDLWQQHRLIAMK